VHPLNGGQYFVMKKGSEGGYESKGHPLWQETL
jgi:hypothetical protein